MVVREKTKTLTKVMDTEPEERATQRRRPDDRRYRLQVDRQTKGSYVTAEDAEQAGLVIKRGYPILQVVVYDAIDGETKLIELPAS